MTTITFRRAAVAAVALLVPSVAAGQILEVPTQFPTIQAAIDAAPDGASITVLPGQYAPFEIVGKSLSIHGAGSDQVHVGPGTFGESGAVVRDVPGAGEVVLSGMRFSAKGSLIVIAPVTIPNVLVQDCQGAVLLTDIRTSAGPEVLLTSAALAIINSALVVVDASEIRGAPGGIHDPTLTAAHGVLVEAGTLWLSNSLVQAGDHGAQYCYGWAGLAGIHATADSVVYVANSLVRGGRGGSALDFFGCLGLGGSGGPALLATESVVEVVSGTFEGGVPGGGSGCSGNGAPAASAEASSVLVASTVTLSPSTGGCNGTLAPALSGDVFDVVSQSYPTLSVSPAPIQPGGSATLTFAGEAGAFAFLAIGASAGAPLALPPFDGATVLAFTPLVVILAVALDGSGAATIPITAPATTEFAGASFVAQALVFAGADAAFSNPVVIAGAP